MDPRALMIMLVHKKLLACVIQQQFNTECGAHSSARHINFAELGLLSPSLVVLYIAFTPSSPVSTRLDSCGYVEIMSLLLGYYIIFF